MTDEDATIHRAAMSKAFPALPQFAGRAFEALRDSLEGRPNRLVDRYRKQTTRAYKVAGKPRKIRMLGVSRPKIDPH